MANHLIELLQVRMMPLASVRTSEDAAVEPLFRIWKAVVRNGRDATIGKFGDSFSRFAGYYWRSVFRAYLKQRAKEQYEPLPFSALVRDDQLVDWMERGLEVEASPLDALIALESLREMWQLSRDVERREMLMALAYGILDLRIEELALTSTLQQLARSAELADAAWWCFGTRDLATLDPAYWGRSAVERAWSNGLVSNANTRAALRVARAFRLQLAPPSAKKPPKS